MSLRLEMLQVARRAPKLLGESTELVEAFFRQRQAEDGGFVDRAGRSDLYYTVFGLAGLQALEAAIQSQRVGSFLEAAGEGEGLDFVHLCCLARCWAAMGEAKKRLDATRFPERLEQYRAADGGYNVKPHSSHGSAYGAFLALGAYTDLDRLPPRPMELVRSLKHLETEDGAWSNDPTIGIGSTNATAAAATVLRYLEMPVSPAVSRWLLARAHGQGGFVATPRAPMPDLLSTATALHALAGLDAPLQEVQESCLDFMDTLWTNEGGFFGSWADNTLDSEYTFYGLLALGHLSF